MHCHFRNAAPRLLLVIQAGLQQVMNLNCANAQVSMLEKVLVQELLCIAAIYDSISSGLCSGFAVVIGLCIAHGKCRQELLSMAFCRQTQQVCDQVDDTLDEPQPTETALQLPRTSRRIRQRRGAATDSD